jgi:hypothetical protein
MTTSEIRHRSIHTSSFVVGSVIAGLLIAAGASSCGGPNETSEEIGSVTSDLIISDFRGWNQVPQTGAPGLFTSGPAATTRDTASIDLFARGSDNALWANFVFTFDNWATSTWTGWASLGGNLLGRPSVATWGVQLDSLIVAARGTDNQAYVRVWRPGTGHGSWTDWSQASNGVLSNEPAVAYCGGFFYIFANGTDNQVYWTRNDVTNGFNPGGWSAFTGPIPNGVLTSEPAVACWFNDIFVAGRGTTNLYHVTKSTNLGQTWSAWTMVSNSFTFKAGPALTVSPNGQLNIFGPSAANGAMYNSTSTDQGSSWGTLQSAGGNLTASAGAKSPANGTIQTFGRGTDNTIYWNRYQE